MRAASALKPSSFSRFLFRDEPASGTRATSALDSSFYFSDSRRFLWSSPLLRPDAHKAICCSLTKASHQGSAAARRNLISSSWRTDTDHRQSAVILFQNAPGFHGEATVSICRRFCTSRAAYFSSSQQFASACRYFCADEPYRSDHEQTVPVSAVAASSTGYVRYTAGFNCNIDDGDGKGGLLRHHSSSDRFVTVGSIILVRAQNEEN